MWKTSRVLTNDFSFCIPSGVSAHILTLDIVEEWASNDTNVSLLMISHSTCHILRPFTYSHNSLNGRFYLRVGIHDLKHYIICYSKYTSILLPTCSSFTVQIKSSTIIYHCTFTLLAFNRTNFDCYASLFHTSTNWR